MAKKLVIILLIILSFTFIGCQSKFDDILESCHEYAQKWQKEGMVARYAGWSEEQQKHYVVFARPDLDGDIILKYKNNISRKYGHVVYMYHKKIQDAIFYAY